MHIFAIGDLHLSGPDTYKPMTLFGEQWEDHRRKIMENWKRTVSEEDIVIIAGDVSWAIKLEQAVEDLDAVASLPGKKIIIQGNHDYWWNSVKKMTEMTQGRFFFIRNNFYPVDSATAICGSRGWLTPESEEFDPEEDEKVLRHEKSRIETSLKAARDSGRSDLILVMHYPPFYTETGSSPFRDLIEAYGVKDCVFGHVHGAEAAKAVFQGKLDGCSYHLVSCDSCDFTPVKIR